MDPRKKTISHSAALFFGKRVQAKENWREASRASLRHPVTPSPRYNFFASNKKKPQEIEAFFLFVAKKLLHQSHFFNQMRCASVFVDNK